jgi:hypothetical protein
LRRSPLPLAPRHDDLAVATVAANFRRGVQKDLHLCVGKDRSPNIATLHDDSSPGSEGALLLDHPGPETGVHGDSGGRGRDIGIPDAARNIDLVEEDPVAFRLGLQADPSVNSKFEQRLLFLECEIVFDGFEGESTIHGSGLKVQKPEASRQMSRKSALPRAGGSIDRDDGAFTPGSGSRSRVEIGFGSILHARLILCLCGRGKEKKF